MHYFVSLPLPLVNHVCKLIVSGPLQCAKRYCENYSCGHLKKLNAWSGAYHLCEVLAQGLLAVYLMEGGGGGPMELHISNPKEYMSLKFYTQKNTWNQSFLPSQKYQTVPQYWFIQSNRLLTQKNTEGVNFQSPKIHRTSPSCILQVPPWGFLVKIWHNFCLTYFWNLFHNLTLGRILHILTQALTLTVIDSEHLFTG